MSGPLQIAVSGISGLIGSALGPFLAAGGHGVRRLARGREARGETDIAWDPAEGRIEAAQLEGLDAVIHLAGESIGSGRWTNARKTAIRESRTRGTRLISEALGGLGMPPRVLLCASAVGFYGDRKAEEIDEDAKPGRGFLADLCRDWERAAEPAARRGIRVVHLRFGVVLSKLGGALPRMLTPFRLGLGGRVGTGRQWMSWVALEDVLGAVHFALVHDTMAGAVNVVAPSAVTNGEFARVLGRVLRRPALLPVPAAVLKLVLGEMADELLLAGQRVIPRRLQEAGFRFRHPDLEEALRFELGVSRAL